MSIFEGQEKEPGRDEETGVFLPGNKFWRNKSFFGSRKKFETPQDLLDAAYEYFDWVDDNPLWEIKAFGSGLMAKVPKMRAMTIKGMCVHLGITERTWFNYVDREEFEGVCELIEHVITDQKFGGAAAGFFNAAIIARDLGLSEKVETKQSVSIEVVDSYDEPDQDTDPAPMDAAALPETPLE